MIVSPLVVAPGVAAASRFHVSMAEIVSVAILASFNLSNLSHRR